MESTPPSRTDIRAGIQQAFRENRTLEPHTRASPVQDRDGPLQPSMRVMTPSRVIVSIKDEDREKGDLSLDVAAAVGRTLARVAGRIEALDKRRAELIEKLGNFRSALDTHFRK
ncbi:MAG TPA: hypothetical protein VER55_14105 [Ardenticatenaceae bacterium]|nr:hypothetical protein [Ardenticatenaceae bacterium]